MVHPKLMEKLRQMAKKPPKNPVILIPARMTSTRLPGKPLALIAGQPMIVHVLRRAAESGVGPAMVACDTPEIAAAVEKAGGKAILTNPAHPSGSDRIWEALGKLDKDNQYDAVINLQGDMPLLDPKAIRAAYELLRDPEIDIGTLVAEIKSEEEKNAPQVVKVAIELPAGKNTGRALYFSRAVMPSGAGPFYHHIGIYAYRREALAEFVKAPPSTLEKRENLEQLRALALGLYIGAAVIDTVPFGVDTPADLEAAKRILEKR